MSSSQCLLITGLCSLSLVFIALYRKTMLGDQSELTPTTTVSDGINGNGVDLPVEIISLEPRLSVYRNFLSKEECEYLIELAKLHMKRSRVASRATAGGEKTSLRTSSDAVLTRGKDKIVRDIEKRIAEWTLIPVDHGESLRVLHYQVGQKYVYSYDIINMRSTPGTAAKERPPFSCTCASPVIKGNKWCCTKWIRVNKYN